jgi:hypothetical protein
MNVTTRRVVCIVVAAVVIAAVSATTATPAFAKKPEGKDQPKTEFTIKATLIQDPWLPTWDGTFSATGAIKDSGEAASGAPWTGLSLYGSQGNMVISITGSGFTVVSGTGAYEGLQATGSVSYGKSRGKLGEVLPMTLEGTVLNSDS